MVWNCSRSGLFPTTNKGERVPKGEQYVYHIMPRDDVADVMTEGLRPFYRDKKWDILHAYLDYVASVENVSFRPKSRLKCIFCGKKRKRAISGAKNVGAVAVIDTTQINNSIYRANREKATKVAQSLNQDGSTLFPSSVDDSCPKHARRAYSNSVEYWDSCCSYKDTIESGITEVMIESFVPEDSIVTFYVPD